MLPNPSVRAASVRLWRILASISLLCEYGIICGTEAGQQPSLDEHSISQRTLECGFLKKEVGPVRPDLRLIAAPDTPDRYCIQRYSVCESTLGEFEPLGFGLRESCVKVNIGIEKLNIGRVVTWTE